MSTVGKKGRVKKERTDVKFSNIPILNCQKSENRLNQTGDETCLYSLRLSEIALTEPEKSF